MRVPEKIPSDELKKQMKKGIFKIYIQILTLWRSNGESEKSASTRTILMYSDAQLVAQQAAYARILKCGKKICASEFNLGECVYSKEFINNRVCVYTTLMILYKYEGEKTKMEIYNKVG